MAEKKDKTNHLEVDIPEGVKVTQQEDEIKVKGERGEVARKFQSPHVKIQLKDKKLQIDCKDQRRKHKAVMGAYRSHLANMIKGVQEGVTYQLKVVFAHFPVTVKVQGQEVLISNFLGERHPRRAAIAAGVNVEVKGQNVKVAGVDKEAVAQTAANLEQATKIKNFDPRVFQDGIYIIEKDGKNIR